MTLFWFPRKRSPQKAMTAALGSAADVPSFAPAVGVTQTKEATMTTASNDKQLFNLGQIVTTPGAKDACSSQYMWECLKRHMCGDWGNVCKEDAATNAEAVKEGSLLHWLKIAR
jgi:hypothetical protein